MAKQGMCLISGIVSSVIGIYVLIGWLLGSLVMVQIIPGSPVMVLNTALLFLLLGSIFILDCLGRDVKKLQAGLALSVTVVALLISIENLLNINLGLDWSRLHQSIVMDSHFVARPGKLASVGFLLLGGYLFIKDKLAAEWAVKSAMWVAYGVIIMSGLGCLISVLKIELLFPWIHSYTMGYSTACIMIFLGVGLKCTWGSIKRKYKKEDIIIPFVMMIYILLGIVVVSAYSPIGQTYGGGMVPLSNMHELLKQRFAVALFIVAVLIILGIFLLNKFLHEFLLKLGASEDVAAVYAQKLYHVEDQLRTITDSLPALVAYLTKDGCYEFVNKTFEDWYRIPRNKVIGKSISQVLGEENYRHIKPFVMQVLSGEVVSFEQEALGSSRVPRFTMTTFTPSIKGKKIDGFYVMVSDISNRKIHEENITHLAHHDNLTGLANRALFYQRLELAILNCKRNFHISALLYMDVDKFKSINDTLGHAIGDALLKEFARRLVASVRSTDTVSRLGGDEFTVIVEAVGNQQNAEFLINKILEEIRKPFDLDGKPYNITSSIGVAYFNPDVTNKDDLIKRSDEALYKAKHAGRNCFRVAD